MSPRAMHARAGPMAGGSFARQLHTCEGGVGAVVSSCMQGLGLRPADPSRGHQRSSEVLRGHQRSSEVFRGLQSSSEVIRGHQRSSVVVRGHQRVSEGIRGHQRPSEVIRGLQRSSEVIRDQRSPVLKTTPSPHTPCRQSWCRASSWASSGPLRRRQASARGRVCVPSCLIWSRSVSRVSRSEIRRAAGTSRGRRVGRPRGRRA